MSVYDVVHKRRSVRSFRPTPLDREVLKKLIDGARVGPSAANLQPLCYVVVTDENLCQQIFDCLKWAAYTAPRGTPAEGHRPTAYVAVCIDEAKAKMNLAPYDIGAAAQTIILLALEQGIASCWIKSINYPKASEILGLPEGITLDCIIALGHPDEEPKLVNLETDQGSAEDIKYWRDRDEHQFVPKRNLASVLYWDKMG